MFKIFFFVASLVSLVSASERGLRGGALTTFLDEGDEWKQFTNFQDRFSRKYETITAPIISSGLTSFIPVPFVALLLWMKPVVEY